MAHHTFEANILSELQYSQYHMDCELILEHAMFKDLIGYFYNYDSHTHLLFTILDGKIFNIDTHAVFKPRYITQSSSKQSTSQMSDVFQYSTSFMDAYNSIQPPIGYKAIIRHVFIGDGMTYKLDQDLCAIIEIEEHPLHEPICVDHMPLHCTNHSTMFPFCECGIHFHDCKLPWEKYLATPLTRIIIPLLDTLETCDQAQTLDTIHKFRNAVINITNKETLPHLSQVTLGIK